SGSPYGARDPWLSGKSSRCDTPPRVGKRQDWHWQPIPSSGRAMNRSAAFSPFAIPVGPEREPAVSSWLALAILCDGVIDNRSLVFGQIVAEITAQMAQKAPYSATLQEFIGQEGFVAVRIHDGLRIARCILGPILRLVRDEDVLP